MISENRCGGDPTPEAVRDIAQRWARSVNSKLERLVADLRLNEERLQDALGRDDLRLDRLACPKDREALALPAAPKGPPGRAQTPGLEGQVGGEVP